MRLHPPILESEHLLASSSRHSIELAESSYFHPSSSRMTSTEDKTKSEADVQSGTLAPPTYEAAVRHSEDEYMINKGDLLAQEHVDPVLDAKMKLVNDAIDEIGMTRYQWKLFVLNGFGYAVDSLILLIQSIIAVSAIAGE